MKILHVAADLNPRQGGPTAACLGIARTMARRGHEVRIIASDWGFVPPADNKGTAVRVETFPLDWPKSLRISLPLRRRLAEAVPAADVVHLHSLYLFHDWAAGRACWRCGTPYVVRPHGTLDPYIYRRHRWRKAVADLLFQDAVLRRAAGLHYTAREEWELARPYAKNSRGSIVPLGIDLAECENLPPPSALRGRFPAIGERKVVLFLGRLSFKKGVDVAIKAFREATHGRHDAFLIIAGPDDGMKSDAESLVAALGIDRHVHFTGMVAGDDKRAVLGGSDVFLLPSQSENFGITVIEAAACGIPVVISDRVNIWRDFQEASAGIVAPPTAEAFAPALRQLLDNPGRAAEIGRRGKKLVLDRFTWDALGPRYEEMYAAAARAKALPELA